MNRLTTMAAGTIAAFAMIATTPAVALDLPATSAGPVKISTGAPEDAAGWGQRRRRHRGGIDTGDVIAGVLVIGAIAAIAGSSSSTSRARERDRREEEMRERREQASYNSRTSQSSSGIDRAVDMCVDQVERGAERVDSVDNAARVSDGWRVSGALANGAGWNCWIDNDGRIREVDLGTRFSRFDGVGGANAMADENQLSDADYTRARAATRYQGSQETIDADLDNGPRPAYPGGPLPGEEGYAQAMGG